MVNFSRNFPISLCLAVFDCGGKSHRASDETNVEKSDPFVTYLGINKC